MDNKPPPTEPEVILRAARELISTPEKWIQNNFAHDAYGENCHPTDVGAQCFCMDGALIHVLGGISNKRFAARTFLFQAITTFLATRGEHINHLPDLMFSFNDTDGRKHEDVLAVYDAAIALAHKARKGVL